MLGELLSLFVSPFLEVRKAVRQSRSKEKYTLCVSESLSQYPNGEFYSQEEMKGVSVCVLFTA